jgi:hypothetical protein
LLLLRMAPRPGRAVRRTASWGHCGRQRNVRYTRASAIGEPTATTCCQRRSKPRGEPFALSSSWSLRIECPAAARANASKRHHRANRPGHGATY